MTLMTRLGVIPGPRARAPEPVFVAFADRLRQVLVAERRDRRKGGAR